MRYFRLTIILLFLSILSILIGVSRIQLSEVFDLSSQTGQLLLVTRIPRTASLLLSGAMMSVCGLIMQHITQNRFVSPTTAGTIDSARLGILCVMLFLPNAALSVRFLTAFLFAFAGTFLFLGLTRLLPKSNQMMLPLVGVMFGNILGSVASFFAYQYQLVQNMSSWLQGNFATVMRGSYEMLYLTVPLFIVIILFAYHFTILGLGESFAVNLGLDYQKMQLLGIGLVSMTSAVVLIMVGTIPFLGVIIPNIIARIYGDHVQGIIGLTAFWGSIFLISCDIAARLIIFPYEIPVSVIVGIVGGLVFIFLLTRRGKVA